MRIKKDILVTFEFELSSNEGELLDSSSKSGVITYIHGRGGILNSLEEELEGHSLGDKFEIRISKERAYGHRNEASMFSVPIKSFLHPENLVLGGQFQFRSEHGIVSQGIITKLENDLVWIDGNHPLAGIDLIFNINITEVREPTLEELESYPEGVSKQ